MYCRKYVVSLTYKLKPMETIKSEICHKCGGSGTLDWTDHDGGICYKCEGNGYIGEKPAGFDTRKKAARQQVKFMLEGIAIKHNNTKGHPFYQNMRFSYPDFVSDKMFRMGYSLKFFYSENTKPFRGMTVECGSFIAVFGDERVIISGTKKYEENRD